MSGITIPLSLELTPQSQALINAILSVTPKPGLTTSPPEGSTHPIAIAPQPIVGAYWHGQGGIYCGVLPAVGDRPAQHMVFSEAQEERMTWGEYGKDVPGAKSRHDGRANTQALLATGNKHPAAQWAASIQADGHQDFHLPSQLELFMACVYAQDKFKKEGWYWSSTQGSANFAFVQGFEVGYSDWDGKGGKYRVRAVRWIPVNP